MHMAMKTASSIFSFFFFRKQGPSSCSNADYISGVGVEEGYKRGQYRDWGTK